MQRNHGSFRESLSKLLRRHEHRIDRRQRAARRFEAMEARLMLAADLELPLILPGELENPYAEHALVAEGEGAPLGEGESANPTSLGEFAQALTDAGVRFFGAFWCPHCNRQKELFGDDEDLLPFIEVTAGDPAVLGSVILNDVGLGNDLTLNPTGRPVTSFPTWEFQDETRVEGFQTLASLSELSGIPLPPDVISIETNAGRLELQLLIDEAPNTVENFLRYVNGGVDGQGYTNSILHRSDANFVIQGGGFRPTSLTTTDINEIQGAFNSTTGNFEHHIPTFDPIPDERGAGSMSNVFGTYAMAKNSAGATSEFFFNFNDNSGLDGQGFTVFAVDRDALNPDGTPNTAATVNLIHGLSRVDVDPSNDGTGGFSVFDNVPFTDEGEMVFVQSIDGSGTVTGTVFNDLDRDGVLDNGEPGLGGSVVFSDANGNGALGDDEQSAMTNADGTYTLVLSAGQHTIRRQAVADLLQTAPTSPEVFTLDVEIGGEFSDVRFGVFDVTAPGIVDLLATSDSGNNSDNVTNFNNSSAATALQFDVSDVADGATVRLFSDGIQIGQGTGSGGSVTITTDGSTTLGEGQRSIIATQEVDGVQGPATIPLTVTIDSTLPGAFTTVPPTTVIVGQDISYDASVTDEGNDITYSLTNAPGNATINANGLVSWTPAQGELGAHAFEIVAADTAGNTQTQQLNVTVMLQPVVAAGFKITADANPASPAISQVKTGDTFYLQVSISDLRDDARGVFSFYEDILYDPLLVSAQSVSFTNNYPEGRQGTIVTESQNGANIQTGLIDEVGAFSPTAHGPGAISIMMVEFQAIRSSSDVTTFNGEAPDIFPASDTTVHGSNIPVPSAEVSFGSTQLTINPSFGTNDDDFNFDEDTDNNVLTVLANDSSLDGSTGNLTVTGVELASGQTEIVGTATVAADGQSILYTPPADFNGEVTFDYTVTDGLDNLRANVTVQVSPLNDAPTAVDDTLTGFQEDSINNFLEVLSNDLIAPDANETLRITAVGTPSEGGFVSIGAADNHLLYTPGPNFSGTETFTYTINDRADGTALTSQGTVTVTVDAGNDNPTAINDTFTVEEDSVDNSLDVLANDSDQPDEGETLTIIGAGNTTAGGTVTVSQDALSILYTPAPDHHGVEGFTYTISDGNGGEATASVAVTSNNTNDPPTPVADTFTVTENTTSNTLDVLANDSNVPDPVGETLTVSAIDTTGTAGTVGIAPDSLSVLYTPAADFLGSDTFTYTLSDGTSESSPVTVTVNVVEFVPGSLSGFVYIDSNNNGVRDAGEEAFDGVAISLTGTDDFGNAVSLQTTTDANGAYSFNDLAPGSYTVTETQPTGERNGVPIVDGQDTIGSQGGTVPANDTFSITLTEGTNGTDNNFAELLGRTISGSVRDTSNAVFGNLFLDVFSTDATGLRNSPAIATIQTVGGSFNIDGLPAGDYEIVPAAAQVFLITPDTGTSASINDADSTDNQFTIRGRQARHISLRDISNSVAHAAAAGEFIQAAVNAAGDGWFTFGSHYSDRFTDGQFMLMDGGAMLHIELTTTGGEMQMADIPMNDSRLRHISEEGDFQLVEIDVASDALGLQTMTTAGGEGESALTVAVNAAVVETNIASEGEGEGDAQAVATTSNDHDHDHSHETVTDVSVFQPILGPPEAADITNTLATGTTSVDVLSNNVTLGVISTAALTPSVPLLPTNNATSASQPSDLVDSGLRGAILDELADENEYADPALFVVAPGSDADDDDDELVDQAIEELTDDLLEVLALGAIA